jgi:hypothetical protein
VVGRALRVGGAWAAVVGAGAAGVGMDVARGAGTPENDWFVDLAARRSMADVARGSWAGTADDEWRGKLARGNELAARGARCPTGTRAGPGDEWCIDLVARRRASVWCCTIALKIAASLRLAGLSLLSLLSLLALPLRCCCCCCLVLSRLALLAAWRPPLACCCRCCCLRESSLTLPDAAVLQCSVHARR